MNQLSFDFCQPAAGIESTPADNPAGVAKNNLEQYIKVCGLVAYKDFFIKIKNDLVAIPAGLTKSQYTALAREVYESRAAKVNRTKSRARFFAIKNRNKKYPSNP